jgi:hypothetical protein
MDQFTGTAVARAESLQRKIELQLNQASIRYVFAPMFDMLVEPLSTTIGKGAITPISEQGQPVGEVYLQTLVKEGETFDPTAYDLRNGIGEIAINPAPIVDALLSQYGGQGAVQIKSLFNLEIGKFIGFELNEIIFEGREFETAAAYLERFAFVRSEYVNDSKEPWFAAMMGRVLTELEGSVNVAFAWAKAKAEWSNQAVKSGDLKKFSPAYEGKIFKFSGITPIDEAMNQVALNQASLATSLPTIVTEFKEAVIASKPDYSELGKAIAAGMKDVVTDAITAARQEPTAPVKEEATKPAPAKGGNKSS